MKRALILSAIFSVTACGSAGRMPTRTTGVDFAGVNNLDDGGTIDPNGADMLDPCSAQAKLVYVVDVNNMFSSFAPDKLQFHDIGVLTCPAQGGATPFSMSVDRNAVAWVLYSSGEIFHVDTTTLACTRTNWQSTSNFTTFGMGFTANSMGSSDETLFVASADGLANGGPYYLGAINPMNLQLTQVGSLNGSPELTGTGDGYLWGFFPDPSNPRVAQINKTSGTESHTFPLSPLAGNPQDWAFAFWGGDFYIFLQRDTDSSTTVWHLSQATGQVNAAIPNTGRSIVGAGVSTCAPTQPIM